MSSRQREGIINLEIGADRKARLEAFAAAAGVTLADAVRHAIDRHLAYPPSPAPLAFLPPAPPPPATPTGGAAIRRHPRKKPAGG